MLYLCHCLLTFCVICVKAIFQSLHVNLQLRLQIGKERLSSFSGRCSSLQPGRPGNLWPGVPFMVKNQIVHHQLFFLQLSEFSRMIGLEDFLHSRPGLVTGSHSPPPIGRSRTLPHQVDSTSFRVAASEKTGRVYESSPIFRWLYTLEMPKCDRFHPLDNKKIVLWDLQAHTSLAVNYMYNLTLIIAEQIAIRNLYKDYLSAEKV